MHEQREMARDLNASLSVPNARRVAFLRQASAPTFEESPPRLRCRWLHALEGGKGWSPFGATDSAALEDAYWRWKSEGGEEILEDDSSKEEKSQGRKEAEEKEKREMVGSNDAEEREGEGSKEKKREGSDSEAKESIGAEDQAKHKRKGNNLEREPPDPNEPLPTWRVPVAEDHLYEVDLRSQKLAPVFWKGASRDVIRGSWYYDASRFTPCATELARELEDLYLSIQPWRSFYAEELRSSLALGAAAEDKLKCSLETLKGSYVIFQGPYIARIYTQDFSTRISKAIWTAWSGEHGGGTLLVRGFGNAKKLMRARAGDKKEQSKQGGTAKKNRSGSSNSQQSSSSASRLGPPGADNRGRVRSRSAASDQTTRPKSPASEKAAELSAETESLDRVQIETSSSRETSAEARERRGRAIPKATDGESSEFLRALTSKLGTWSMSSTPPKAEVNLNTAQAHLGKKEQATEGGLQGAGLAGAADGSAIADAHSESEGESRGQEVEDFTDDEEDEEAEIGRERLANSEPVELVLIFHGIGQKLAEEWKGFDFVLACNSFRTLIQKRAAAKPPTDIGGGGVPTLARGRRLQFLPVLWRTTLDFDPTADDEEEGEHLSNRFSLDDIAGEKDSIPLVRTLISNVLLDIPFYLSQHKTTIIKSVVREANRVYRLWCQRNPDFEGQGGRTSIIAHSLGAAIACDILSAQPTHVRLLSKLSYAEAQTDSQLVFNVRTLFKVGSPVSLFFWLNKSQLIARRGRERTKDSPQDEALERAGRYGCLAVDSVFNIFNQTDPVALRLNACVDAPYAKTLKPLPITQATASVLRTLPGAQKAPPSNASSSGFFASWSRASGAISANSMIKATRSGSWSESTAETPDMAEEMFGRRRDRKDNALDGTEKKEKEKKKGTQDDKEEETEKGKEKEKGKGSEDGWMSKLAPRKVRYARKTASKSSEGGGETSKQSTRKGPKVPDPPTVTEPQDSEAQETGSKDAAVEGGSPSSQQIPAQTPSERSRAERRFRALNPHGRVDFVIPLEGMLANQYMDMLSSHGTYWHLAEFADFVLVNLLASEEQLRNAREARERAETKERKDGQNAE